MSAVSVSYLGIPGYVIFWALFALALGLFSRRVYFLLRLVRLGKAENRFDNMGRRLTSVLTQTLSQWCSLKNISLRPPDLAGMGPRLRRGRPHRVHRSLRKPHQCHKDLVRHRQHRSIRGSNSPRYWYRQLCPRRCGWILHHGRPGLGQPQRFYHLRTDSAPLRQRRIGRYGRAHQPARSGP